MEVLRRVWVQQYTRAEDGTVTRREAGFELGLPPGSLGSSSPYDLDARYSQKRGKGWQGYKVHLTETCTHSNPGAAAGAGGPAAAGGLASGRAAPPNLITNVATTAATVPDAAMTEPVHDMLAAAGLTPAEHAADAGVRRRGPAAGRPGPRHHPARPSRCRVLPPGPRRRLHRGHV